jgi:hypothetical protein
MCVVSELHMSRLFRVPADPMVAAVANSIVDESWRVRPQIHYRASTRLDIANNVKSTVGWRHETQFMICDEPKDDFGYKPRSAFYRIVVVH